MRVLVTGSSGRVGRLLVGKLLDQMHDIVGLDLQPSKRVHDRYLEDVGNLTDEKSALKATAGVEAVVHLRALISWDPRDEAELFAANVDGTRAILAASAEAGVRKFVFASCGEVPPEISPKFLPITEERPLEPNSPYGLTKPIGEEQVQFSERAGRMETVILRFSHTQDAIELLDEDSFLSRPWFYLRSRIRQQEALGNHEMAEFLRSHDPGGPAHIVLCNEQGEPYRMHITDTRDMVSSILLAVSSAKAVGEVFNLGATESVCLDDLVEALSRVTGYPVVKVDMRGAGDLLSNFQRQDPQAAWIHFALERIQNA